MTKFLALVALLLATWLLPFGDARADTIEQAYAKCQHELATVFNDPSYTIVSACARRNLGGTGQPVGVFVTSFTQYGSGPNDATNWAFYTDCASGQTFNRTSGLCETPPPPCSATGPALGNMYQPEGTPLSDGSYLSHTQSCNGGCEYFNNSTTGQYSSFKIDGTTYIDVTGWIPSGASCTTGTTTTPPTDTDGDGTSDSKDGAPGDPGSQGTPDPNNTDPSCGGAGQPLCPDKTDGSDHTSTGGGDCNTPPSSTGDPILAQIAFQTWATRCELKGKANGTPGSGVGGFGGTDMTATNSKLDAIKGDLDGIKDWATGALGSGHANDDTGLDVTADAAVTTHEIADTGLDQSGFGWSRSCPAPPTATVFGQTLTFNTDILCNWLAIGGWFVLLITGWRCIQTVVNA